MEDLQLKNSQQDPEVLFSNSLVSSVYEWEKGPKLDPGREAFPMDEDRDSLIDSMICDSNSRLVPSGFSKSDCKDDIVMFVNVGGEASVEADSTINFTGDTYFEGGNVFRTNEHIVDGGDYPFIYKSARLGNFSYRICAIPPGNYFVDLHFVEIINMNGPKGMRVFNVFLQEEKVLSGLDIFAVVGANKPLKFVDSRVKVKDDGVLLIRFEGINGSPVTSGICIRKASHIQVPSLPQECFKCNKCDAQIDVSSAQKKLLRRKATDNYEKKIEELSEECRRKTNECHEAWLSLTEANDQLEKVRVELDNKTFQIYSLDRTVGTQAEKINNVTSMYDHDKEHWEAAIKDLQEKVKLMKEEHAHLSREAHECADSIPELNQMVTGVRALVAKCEDLKMKFSEEHAKRKELYNQIQESKGNIRVFCRCRPLSKEEVLAGCATVVEFDAAKDGDLTISSGGSTKKTYRFDRVYTPKDDQVDVFADASPLVVSVLDGYNVCIFAYGQTGTGKTFTMEGTDQNRGVNYRTLEQLFKVAQERSGTVKYDISVSVLEVYNEQIRDLLATSPGSRKLEIKQSFEGSHHVPGIVEAKVDNIKDVWNVLQSGSNTRAVGSNNVNEHSSRSHCMLCIMVKAKNLMSGECTKSKLWLVDLAGSERLAKTDAQGERLKEAQNINRSLSAIGDVIFALATKSSHIPYRNSKLTHLLQDSLGGDSKTLMFVQISPSDQDLSETLSSLNFATRVRGVELGPARKQIDTSELQKMKSMLEKAKQESRSKDESLRKLEETLQNMDNKAKGKDQVHRSQQEKIKELEGQLEMRTALHSQSQKQVSQLSDRLKESEELCSSLQQKIDELEAKLGEQRQLEATSFQQRIKELENKLKEQVHESESHSLFLKNQVNELERKLKEQDNSSEVFLLEQKIKQLEEKLKVQQKQMHTGTCTLAETTRATPCERKSDIRDEEFQCGNEDRILRNSNSISRPSSCGSTLPNGNDDTAFFLHETRKKRHSRTGEAENTAIPGSFSDNRIRKSDPPRMMRSAKLVSAATQGPTTHKRVIRDQGQGIKEKDTKKKIWTR